MIYVVRIVIIFLLLTNGLGAELTKGKVTLELPKQIEETIGIGKWLYHWPHGILPLKAVGFELISGPFDSTEGNKGMTMSNWEKAVVYASRTTEINISVWILKDFSKENINWRIMQIGPIRPINTPIQVHTIEFHGLKAAFGQLTTFQSISPFTTKVYFAFRIQEKLFLFQCISIKPKEEIEDIILNLAEQVYQFNIKK